MKMVKIFIVLSATFVIAFSIFVVSSCHKSATTEDTGYANEQALTEKTFNDISSISDQAATVSSGNKLNYRTTTTTLGACATVTKDSAFVAGIMTYTITVDFGTVNCVCNDGRLRRGKIIITHAGHYADLGYTHTFTFDNFYQDNNKVTGTKMVTNMGTNSLGQPYFNVTIDGSLTRSTGGTISVNWTRVRTWTNGYNTPNDPTDDIYSISGSGSIARANGTVVNVNISALTPLIVAHSCKWIEAGTIIYTLPSGKTRSLNYGDTPNCDDIAQITLANGVTKNITLP